VTNPLQKSTDPYANLVAEIAEIRKVAEEALRKPFRIPVLNADPAVTDPTSIWLFPDGRLRARHLNPAGSAFITREWVPTAPGAATSAAAPAANPTTGITRQDTWPATWSQSYRQSGAARTDEGTVMLYYGSSGDPFNGQNRSLIGFDYTAIAAALAGSTINGVWLQLQNAHSWYYSGVQIHFGIHNFTSEPSTWGGGLPRRVSHKFGSTQWREVPMPIEFAVGLRDGWGAGITIEAPNPSREFYGYAAGVGSGQRLPQLVVNYTK
jgi:hypothetical protein